MKESSNSTDLGHESWNNRRKPEKSPYQKNYYNDKQPKTAKLSEAEARRYKSKGCCFQCVEKGYISNNYLKNDKAQSPETRPLKIRSNNINFSISETKSLQEAGQAEI